MKKILLTFAFIFATSFVTNAKPSSENSSIIFFDCFDAALKASRDLGNCMNITYEQEHVYFLLIYDACEAE